MAATDNDALLKAMDQLMKEEDRASVIEYAKQLSTKGGDVVGTMRKMSQQGVDTKKEAAMWKKRALLTAAVAVVVCAVMLGLMVAAAELTKDSRVYPKNSAGTGRRLVNTVNAKTFNGDLQGNADTSAASATTKRGTTVYDKATGGVGSRRLSLKVAGVCDGCTDLLHVKLPAVPAGTRQLDDEGRELVAPTATIIAQIAQTNLIQPQSVSRRLDTQAPDAPYLTHKLDGSNICVSNDGENMDMYAAESDGTCGPPPRRSRRLNDAPQLVTTIPANKGMYGTNCVCLGASPCDEDNLGFNCDDESEEAEPEEAEEEAT